MSAPTINDKGTPKSAFFNAWGGLSFAFPKHASAGAEVLKVPEGNLIIMSLFRKILMTQKTSQKTMLTMSAQDRLTQAEQYIAKIVDYAREAIHLQATNEHFVYHDALSKQVDRTFAANAFTVLQSFLFRSQVMRLCTMWDRFSTDRHSLQTVADLLDDSDVLNHFEREDIRKHPAYEPHMVAPDLSLKELDQVKQLLSDEHASDGVTYAAARRGNIVSAIAKVRTIAVDARLGSLRTLRDSAIAHVLEQGMASVPKVKYGDEKWLLDETIAIVELLYGALHRVAYDWPEVRRIANLYANACWTDVKISPTR